MSMGKDSILWRITKNPPPNLGLGSLSKEENVRAESREESSECCHLDMTIALTMQLYNLFVLLVGCFSWLLHEFFLDSFCFFNLSPTNVFCSLAQFLLGQLSSLFSLLAQSTFNCLFNSAPPPPPPSPLPPPLSSPSFSSFFFSAYYHHITLTLAR